MTRYLLIVFFVFVFSIFGNAQSQQKKRRFRSPFRYAIINDKFDPAIGVTDDDRRFIEVLLDNRSFTKNNLIKLLKLISVRYPKPILLYIDVFTSLNDIETPEEREQPKLSGTDSLSDKKQGNLAVFVRSEEKSFFYIYYSNGNFDEVQIK